MSIHDQLFQHQQEITASNVKQKLVEYAQSARNIDIATFKTCLDDEMSLGLVLRDMNLAAANDVQGTPTLFINGRKVLGVKDAGELRQLILDAHNDKRQREVTAAHPETGG